MLHLIVFVIKLMCRWALKISINEACANMPAMLNFANVVQNDVPMILGYLRLCEKNENWCSLLLESCGCKSYTCTVILMLF